MNRLNFCSDIYCKEDMLGFAKYVDTLSSMIRDKNFTTPFCIGIYGKWGAGKTSFMHLLENKLRDDASPPHIIPVWFNPWRYQKEEHLIIPFLKTIEQSIQKHIRAYEDRKTLLKFLPKLKGAAEKIGEVASAFAFGIKAEFKLGPAGLTFDAARASDREEALTKRRMEEAKKLSQKLSSIYYDIVAELRDAVDEKDFRIGVFIDDLDRCLPEKAVELLEAIKLFLDLKGYLFVIGVAKDVVEKGISYRYRFYDHKHEEDTDKEPVVAPDEYLEKMIQMPFELPPVEPSKKLMYIESLLGDADDYKRHIDIIHVGVGANPRALKRFINLLAFTSQLAETIKESVLDHSVDHRETDDHKDIIEKGFVPVLYIKWAIIVFKFPQVHLDIKANRYRLIELQEAARGEPRHDGTEREKTFQMPERLKKVLRTGEPFPNDDWLLARFVHLTEATDIRAKDADTTVRYTRTYSFRPGDMVRIPKGSFLFGDEKEEKEINYDYWIDVFLVTNRQYREFLCDPEYRERKVPYRKEESAQPYNWNKVQRTFPEGRDDHPVVLVSYHDAVAFCQWRSKKEGRKYRLPTEEEWERAARGSDGREYPWGDTFDKTKCNTKESSIGETTPVTSYPEGASPHQCQDMAGNVWEWTDSWYDNDKSHKVLRGGSWDYNRNVSRCAHRDRDILPEEPSDFGFRCVRV